MAEVVPAAVGVEFGLCLDLLWCDQDFPCDYLVYGVFLAILFVCIGLGFQQECHDGDVASERALIHVTLYRLSGASLDIKVPRHIDVRTLKEHIENDLSYPVGCQQLVHDTLFLEDDLSLSSFHKEKDATLELSMMISHEFLKDMLRLSQSHCEYFRLRAIYVFRSLGAQAGEIGVKALLNCLQDNCWPLVRRRALDALLQMASCGDERSISSLTLAIQLVPETDSSLLAHTWLQLLKGHNRHAIVALVKLLKSACFNRHQAVCTLLREVRMEDGNEIVKAAKLLQHWSAGVAKPEETFALLSMGNAHAQTEWKQFRRKGWRPKRDRCLMKIKRSQRIHLLRRFQAKENELTTHEGIFSCGIASSD